MGMPSVPELFIFIFIGFFVWLFFKKSKKKIKKPSSGKEGGQSNAKPKFCSECGAPLGENDRFCPVCGAKVVDMNNHSKKKFPTKKKPI